MLCHLYLLIILLHRRLHHWLHLHILTVAVHWLHLFPAGPIARIFRLGVPQCKRHTNRRLEMITGLVCAVCYVRWWCLCIYIYLYRCNYHGRKMSQFHTKKSHRTPLVVDAVGLRNWATGCFLGLLETSMCSWGEGTREGAWTSTTCLFSLPLKDIQKMLV